jgi:RND family efflux transporter MFP subunit
MRHDPASAVGGIVRRVERDEPVTHQETPIYLRSVRWLLPVAILAIGVAAALVLSRPEDAPVVTAESDAGRVVRYITAERRDIQAELRGYGNVRPGVTWTAVARVAGDVVFKNESLETGQPIVRGTVLVRIDGQEYELAAARRRAELAQVDQALAQLDQEHRNLERQAEILGRRLEIAESEVRRITEAHARGAANQSDLDARQQQVLAHRAELQQVQNSLDLLPSRQAEQEATRAAAKAALDRAELDLTHCEIRAPFDGRVRRVEVEQGRNIGVGEELVELFSVEQAELHCQVALDDLEPWLPDELRSPLNEGTLNQPWVTKDGPIRGTVTLATSDGDIKWDGELDRFLGELDPFTRMLTVVIRVDEPYKDLGRGERPPLVEGMFCEGVLLGRRHEGVYPVPARAVHDGRVYIMNAVGELEIRSVSVRFVQGDLAIVDDGLVSGDRIVVTDLQPAVAGMRLRGEREDITCLAGVPQ